MKSASWVALLQRFPPAQHDALMLVTATGTEIAIQSILRTEDEYAVLRGRMAGTDLGRIIFIPYNQITYLGFQKAVKEAAVRALYGEGNPEPAPPPKVETEIHSSAKETNPPQPEAGVEPAGTPLHESPPPGRNSAPRIPLPSKSAMLERLRSRLQGGPINHPDRAAEKE